LKFLSLERWILPRTSDAERMYKSFQRTQHLRVNPFDLPTERVHLPPFALRDITPPTPDKLDMQLPVLLHEATAHAPSMMGADLCARTMGNRLEWAWRGLRGQRHLLKEEYTGSCGDVALEDGGAK
jgi:hypothetical protein